MFRGRKSIKIQTFWWNLVSSVQVKIKETLDLTKDDEEHLSCSDDEYDLTPEELDRKYGPFMKPHRYRAAPCQTAPLEDALVSWMLKMFG